LFDFMRQIVFALPIVLLIAACQGPSAPPSETVQEGEAVLPEGTVPASSDGGQGSAIANPDSASAPIPIKTGTVRAEPSLRIHESPGTNTPVIYAAPNGTPLNIYAETAMGDSTWYQVKGYQLKPKQADFARDWAEVTEKTVVDWEAP
jgi:hypothetical protein